MPTNSDHSLDTTTKSYFLGIDNGGTVAKAAIFDSQGTEIGVASETIPFQVPQPGFAERDMGALWSANARIIRKVLNTTGIQPSEIGGVGCTGHGKGLYLWGKNGAPAHAGIISTDSRAWKYPIQWEKDGTTARVRSKTYQKILACQPTSLLAWFKDNNPALLDTIQWIFEAKDFIRFMLTDKAQAEITDYSGSGLMNIRDRCFEVSLLKEYGLAELFDALPPLIRSVDLAGSVTKRASEETGLVEGTAVAGGMFDIDACAVASGVVDPSAICVVAGTWSINEYVAREPVTDGSVMMNSLFCLPEYYLIEESSPTSAGNYEWFINYFLDKEKAKAEELGISVFEFAEKMAAEITPEECDLIFLPFIFGSNYNPEARAVFAGFSARHTRAHMIRAVLEGVAFSHKTHLEKLLAQRSDYVNGVSPVIRLTGGAAKSRLWVQIMADVFCLPIETVSASEPGALGAAMSAAVASGHYRDLSEASSHMVRIANRIEPDPSASEIYQRKYRIYRDISEALDHVWSAFTLQTLSKEHRS